MKNHREHQNLAVCKPKQFVIFALDGQRYALDLSVVEKVIRVVEVTPLPDAPENILGVINLHGWVIPALDVRKLFHLPEKGPELSDQMIITRSTHFGAALPVDEVASVVECDAQNITVSDEIFPGIVSVKGAAKLNGSIIFIYDLDRFLTHKSEELKELGLEERGRTSDLGTQQ